ncbi:MAG: hypothetical protein IKG53_11080, partial [Solobacterium sp.]|nr:hypothetical protein [Solobacterium sp.]
MYLSKNLRTLKIKKRIGEIRANAIAFTNMARIAEELAESLIIVVSGLRMHSYEVPISKRKNIPRFERGIRAICFCMHESEAAAVCRNYFLIPVEGIFRLTVQIT